MICYMLLALETPTLAFSGLSWPHPLRLVPRPQQEVGLQVLHSMHLGQPARFLLT